MAFSRALTNAAVGAIGVAGAGASAKSSSNVITIASAGFGSRTDPQGARDATVHPGSRPELGPSRFPSRPWYDTMGLERDVLANLARGIMINSPMAIANVFLDKPGALGRLTQIQIMNLTYIAHGWNLAVNGTPLFPDQIEARHYGPVIASLYDHMRYNGNEPVIRKIEDTDSNAYLFYGNKPSRSHVFTAKTSSVERDVLDRVWGRYGNLSGFQLSLLNREAGSPWHQTYYGDPSRNKFIPNELIRNYFITLARQVA
jgi:uncharacterized phage-associated protein